MYLTLNFIDNLNNPISPPTVGVEYFDGSSWQFLIPVITVNSYRYSVPSDYLFTQTKIRINAQTGLPNVVPFSQIITVFGYDVTFNVVMNTDNPLNISSLIHNVIGFRQPYSPNVNLYAFSGILSTLEREYIWDVNGEKIHGMNTIVCKGQEIEVSQTINFYQTVNCVRTLVGSIDSSAITIPAYENHETHFSTSMSCENCTERCTNVNTNNKLTLFSSFDAMKTYVSEGVTYPFVSREIINVRLKNTSGTVLQFVQYESLYTSTPSSFDFNFMTPEIGDYVIDIERYALSPFLPPYSTEDVPVKECFDTLKLKSCNFYELYLEECELTIYNWANEEIQIEIKNIITDKIETITIANLDEFSTKLSDGVYLITVTGRGQTLYHEVSVFCQLIKCAYDKIKDLVCEDKKSCKTLDYTNFTLTLFTFFNMVNRNYSDYLTFLNDEEYKRMYDTATVLERLLEQCNPCSTNDTCSCK